MNLSSFSFVFPTYVYHMEQSHARHTHSDLTQKITDIQEYRRQPASYYQ